MDILILVASALLVTAVVWRFRNRFGVELRGIRAERMAIEKETECCCEKKRRAHERRVEARLKRKREYYARRRARAAEAVWASAEENDETPKPEIRS